MGCIFASTNNKTMETNNKRPKVVQAPEGNFGNSFTEGMNYNVISTGLVNHPIYGRWLTVEDNYGEPIHCNEKQTSYLNGGNWIIVETE